LLELVLQFIPRSAIIARVWGAFLEAAGRILKIRRLRHRVLEAMLVAEGKPAGVVLAAAAFNVLAGLSAMLLLLRIIVPILGRLSVVLLTAGLVRHAGACVRLIHKLIGESCLIHSVIRGAGVLRGLLLVELAGILVLFNILLLLPLNGLLRLWGDASPSQRRSSIHYWPDFFVGVGLARLSLLLPHLLRPSVRVLALFVHYF